MARKIVTYRDKPKPGETDAGWCGHVASTYGHIVAQTSGHATEAEAAEALGVADVEGEVYYAR